MRTRAEVQGCEPVEVLAREQHEAVVQVQRAYLLLPRYIGRDERIAVLETERLSEEPS